MSTYDNSRIAGKGERPQRHGEGGKRYPSAMPSSATNWMSVWRRNYLVWKKLAIASMFGNLADPMIYLFGLGLGLGLMVGRVDGVSTRVRSKAASASTSDTSDQRGDRVDAQGRHVCADREEVLRLRSVRQLIQTPNVIFTAFHS